MPSPLAHLSAGYLIYRGSGREAVDRTHGRFCTVFEVLFLVFLSQLPDMDSVAGFLSDDFGAYHNQFSHSLLTGLAVATVIGVSAHILRLKPAMQWFWIALLSYELHVVMDFFTVGRGVRLFWPFMAQRFQSPVKLFYGLHWSEGFFSIQHVWTVLTEGLFVLVIAGGWILMKGMDKRKRRRCLFVLAGVVLAGVLFPVFAQQKAYMNHAGTGGKSPAAYVRDLTGSHSRIVWCRDCDEMNDVYALGDKLDLVGLDTEDGYGERVIVPGPRNISRPVISPCGRYIFFSDRSDGRIYRVEWDGSGLTAFAQGRTLDTWKDPETGAGWVIVGSADREHPRYHSRVVRYCVEDSEVVEPVCDGFIVNENNFQLSETGRFVSADVDGEELGVIDLVEDRFEEHGGGCWPSMSPDDSGRSWRMGNGHRELALSGPDGSRRIAINDGPGMGGHEVFHPRWSNRSRFMVLSGPYKEGLGFNRIGNGGPAVEIYIGRFSEDYSKIEGWAKVSSNECADFYPDAWIEGE